MAASQIWVPYCGSAPVPAEWLARWNLDPALLLVLIASTVAGLRLLGPGAPPMRRGAFAAAMLLFVVLFVSPFCALTSALFSARIVHHVVLTAIAAPLLVAASPRVPALRGSLPFWTGLHAVVFWSWHAPPFYAAALSNDGIYWLMQSTLLASAIGLWLAVRRANVLGAASALLATMVQMGLLGALLTFISTPLYAPHFASTAAWGLSTLDDQQLAGLIMWAPSAGLYLAAALLLVGRWFHEQSRAAAT